MAYKKSELLKTALKVIEKHGLFFVSDVTPFLPCVESTFYKQELHKSEEIKEALNKNKISTKVSLRGKWSKTDNATLQVALYKLICTEEEHKRLAVGIHNQPIDTRKEVTVLSLNPMKVDNNGGKQDSSAKKAS